MTKPMLIGLHGKPRVGKDTVALHLIAKFNLLRYGPSVPMKDTTAAMFGVPREYFDDDNMKDQVDPYWGITYRQMCQKVGKESSRDVFGDDIWLRHVERKIAQIAYELEHGKQITMRDSSTWKPPVNGIILADIRYENEVHWVKKNGGNVIFILRNNAPKSSDQGHVVDSGLPVDLADMLIYNNGTIEQLHTNVDRQMAFYYSWPEN